MMSEEKILTQEIAEQVLEDLEDQDWGHLNEFTSIEDAAAKILGKWESGRVVLLSLSLKSHPSSHISSPLKPQASSLKPQASSLKPQASSLKPQASSLKPIAAPVVVVSPA